MRYFPLLLLLVSLSFPKVFIESNYPLRNNNFQRIATEENLFLILWALQKLKDVKDIRIMSVGKDTVIYVERYPILKKVEIRGNWFAGDEEIKNLILAREGEPLVNFDPKEAERTLKLFYRSRGFLYPEVHIGVRVDEKGFAYMKVEIREGELYFLGGALFKGAKHYDNIRLLTEAGLRLGEIYNEERAKKGSFKVQEFYRKRGFLESLVYYERTEKVRARKPFVYVLFPGVEATRRRFIDGAVALFRGISNFLSHPIAVTKTLFGKGRLAVPVYLVSEGERFKIGFEGNESFEKEDLMRLIDTDTPGVDLFFLEGTRERIEEFYRSKGFFDVKVDYSFKEGRINFKILEGERYRLVPLGFKGLKLPEFYDREAIESIRNAFLDKVKERGYLLARLNLIEEVDRQKKRVYLIVDYDPGKRIVLKDIKYLGKDRELKGIFSRYRALLPSILDEKLLDSLHRDIRKYLDSKGYLDGDYSVKVRVEEKEDEMLFTYLYRVKEGKRYRYGELLIYGNEKTHHREIYYTVVKQRYFSIDAEEESLWNLIQSENFTGVRIENFVDREKKLVHRLVEVREDKRGLLELAVGYNTEEKLKLEGGVKLKNLFGVGITAKLSASRSQKYQTYELSLSDKFLFSRKYFGDVSAFRRLEFHGSFDLESTGYSLSFGYRPKRWYSVSIFASRTSNDVSGAGAGTYDLTKFGVYLVREKRDDPVNPSNVTHNSVRLTRAQGDRDYYTVEINNFILREIIKGLALNGKFALGWAGEEAPVFDRFFLGGLRDMRGYDYEAIGYPEGGRTYAFGRAEVLFSVREPVWAGTYAEAGNVGENFSKTFKDLKYDLGVALGARTPAGFIRLDLAKPLNKVGKPTSKFKIYLSIGFVY